MRRSSRTLPAIAVLAVLTLGIAACGGDDDDTATTEPAAAPTEAAAGGDAVVALASTSLGEVAVEQNGLTVYGFTPDTSGVPTCYDDCAAAWPPVLVDAGADLPVGDGLDAAMFTTVARDDTDQLQVVFGDWPLYTFAGDQAAGDVNGQGVNDVWFVVTGDAQLMMPASLTSASPPNDYGY